MMSLLTTRELRADIGDKRIGGDLDLAVEAGQCWALLGANGAGKTTLLHTLAGLRPPAKGEILLNDQPLARWSRRQIARHLGILLQDSDDPFPATVLETALIGRHPHLGPWQWEGPEDHALAEQALAEVELQGLGHRGVDTLSGGERRRLALATLRVQDPRVALLDEPTNHLDLHHQIRLLGHLRDHARDNDGALVMALHDVNLAARFCDHVLMIFADGEIQHGPAAELMRADYLTCLYHHPIEEVATHGHRAFLPA